ncbi:MAG: Asp23/Gls24 family envelope stress response protein [Myxococcota bacterium]
MAAKKKSETRQADKNVTTIEDKPRGEGQVGGKLNLTTDVVGTIAGLAAREVDGIAQLGRSRLVSFGDAPTRGIDTEVGQQEAAFDMEVVIDYGYDLRKVADHLRKKVAEQVDRMAGRKVVEVNIDVVDIRLPEEEQSEPEPERRVR